MKLDLLAGGNYPFSDPAAICLGAPLPWSPHFHPSSGTVCLGDAWRSAQGRMLAGQIVVHIMRLLNFDEPDQERYGGWNPPAVRYWRSILGTRPLHPDLQYPVLPAEVTHALYDANSRFQPIGDGSGSNSFVGASVAAFAPAPLEVMFVPVGDADGGGFQPLGGAL
ncbi:MAG: hypothetical protein WCG85_04620 [Polyangia bacterium]